MMVFLYLIDLICVLILCAIWFMTIKKYSLLPNLIPIKSDFDGNPYKYGSKKMIYLMPVLATFFVAVFFVIFQFPETYNYPVEITEENEHRQSIIALFFLRFVLFFLLFIFMNIQDFTIRKAINVTAIPRVSFVNVFLGWLIFIIIAISVSVIIG